MSSANPVSAAIETPAHGARSLVITPTSRLGALQLRELWEYRELLYFFIWRNIKIRYKQTALGAAWSLLQPLLLMLVFTIFLGRLGGIAANLPNNIPYPLFSLAALVPWMLFSQGVAASADSLVSNANLIGKIYFPRLLLPLAATVSFLFDLLIALVLLVAIMAGYGRAPRWDLLPLLIPFALLVLATSAAVGILLSAVNVRFRDVRYGVPFLIQLWLFASPIAYPASRVPHAWRLIYALNPIATVVEGFRGVMLGTGLPGGGGLWASLGVVVVFFAVGLWYFTRTESTFADLV